jgi:hypothetical protein
MKKKMDKVLNTIIDRVHITRLRQNLQFRKISAYIYLYIYIYYKEFGPRT